MNSSYQMQSCCSKLAICV